MSQELEQHSCLLDEQHGYEEEEAVPLSETDVAAALATALEEAKGEEVQAAGVSRPRIKGVYQAKAATYQPRANSQIDSIIIHTPEGYEGGTLSVLQQGRAGFDWFLPPSGNLYKCNAFGKYIAWQAGHWPYNQRSIGVEQWDFAANMGRAPDAHYRRLAGLVAWLTQLLDIPVRRANYGQPGLIAHAQVTPGARTDPGRNFDWDKLIRYTKQARNLGDGGEAPTKPPSDIVFRVIAGSFKDQRGAGARARQLQAKGFSTWVYRKGSYYRVQIGGFDNARKADELVTQARAAGFEAYALAEKG